MNQIRNKLHKAYVDSYFDHVKSNSDLKKVNSYICGTDQFNYEFNELIKS